jgi:hypothetical protein
VVTTVFGPQPALFWVLLIIPGLVIAALPFTALALPAAAERLPWLCGWTAQLRRADLHRRAALAARWRLTEAEIGAHLGADCLVLAPLLGDADAEAHCLRLAEHHAAAARRGMVRLGWMVALGLYLCAGAVFLTMSAGVVHDWTTTLASTSDAEHDLAMPRHDGPPSAR